MTEGDPPRIGEPGGPPSSSLDSLVREARRDVGSQGEVDALRAALGAQLWPEGAGGAEGGSNADKSAQGGAGKLAASTGMKIGIGVLGAAVAIAWWLSTRSPGAPVAAGNAAGSVTQAPGPGPGPGPAPEPERGPAPEPERGPAPEPKPAPIPSPSPSLAPGRVPAESEASLLGRAQAALASNPALALSLCEQHRALYHPGMMVQEREVLAVEALVRIGNLGAARVRATRFEKAFPRSAYRSKIEALVSK